MKSPLYKPRKSARYKETITHIPNLSSPKQTNLSKQTGQHQVPNHYLTTTKQPSKNSTTTSKKTGTNFPHSVQQIIHIIQHIIHYSTYSVCLTANTIKIDYGNGEVLTEKRKKITEKWN